MALKKINWYNIPHSSSTELRELARTNNMDIDQLFLEYYGARVLPETFTIRNQDSTARFYKVWGFTDMDKYTEFCLKWL